MWNLGEGFLAARSILRGEITRQRLLFGAQNVAGEYAILLNGLAATRAAGYAHQHERGVERDGRKCARGQPVGVLDALGRDDGDTGGKTPQGITELAHVERLGRELRIHSLELLLPGPTRALQALLDDRAEVLCGTQRLRDQPL